MGKKCVTLSFIIWLTHYCQPDLIVYHFLTISKRYRHIKWRCLYFEFIFDHQFLGKSAKNAEFLFYFWVSNFCIFFNFESHLPKWAPKRQWSKNFFKSLIWNRLNIKGHWHEIFDLHFFRSAPGSQTPRCMLHRGVWLPGCMLQPGSQWLHRGVNLATLEAPSFP